MMTSEERIRFLVSKAFRLAREDGENVGLEFSKIISYLEAEEEMELAKMLAVRQVRDILGGDKTNEN